MNRTFNIGPLSLTIKGFYGSDAGIPANLRPFVAGDSSGPTAILEVEKVAELPAPASGEPLSTSYNDLGSASLFRGNDGGWIIALTPCPGEIPRTMVMSADFTEARVYILESDRYAHFVMDSMARIFFSQHAASRGALMLHASVVEADGNAYLFMGKSGTGKSTHSRLWLDNFPGSSLLNDDCPMVYEDEDGRFMACGTPWSGKTPCWRNACCPVGGIARLRQAPVNRFIPTNGVESFVEFIPGMSVMTSDPLLYSEASSTALRLLESVNVGILECRPDRDAALMSRNALDNNYNKYTKYAEEGTPRNK